MTVVDFLRHGATEQEGVLLGHTDPRLSEAGRVTIAEQCRDRSWAAVIASPLMRAKLSAEIATGASQQIETEPDWTEIFFGDWDGKPLTDLRGEQAFTAFYAQPEINPPPNGETMARVRARVTTALEKLAAREESPLLVVAHGGSIRMALSVLFAIQLDRLWAIRIACGTLIRVELGVHPAHGLWGQLLEIHQPRERAP